MANTLPSPTRDSQKTPVIVILKDSRVSLHSQPDNILIWYINPLLKHLRRANQTSRPCRVALVGYGPVHCASSSLHIIPFSPFDPHNKSTKLPTVPKISESPSVMTALDGYFTAIKMIDGFQKNQGVTKQDPKEEFSYHLWHIAAGQDDESAPSFFSFSQVFWNVTWDDIPAQLQSRNINLSVILLGDCPRYSDLFSAVSPQPIKPWFGTCPHHTILLSGFEHSLTPKLEDAALSTVLAKRPTDAPVDHRARRLKTEDSSQPITALSSPQSAYASPTTPQARVKAPDSPIEPSPCEGQDMMNDQWTGTLSWAGEESDVCASVQATDGVRDPQLSVWPSHLRLEVVGTRIHALDFQAWILKHRASVVRIQCAANIGEQDFGKLVKSLREDGHVAIARLETGGSLKRGLVLAPLHGGLLCAAFLTSDIPELPSAPLEQPQQDKEPKPDSTYAADISFDTPEYLQGDPSDSPTNVFVAGPLAQSTLPQQFPSQQPQIRVQGPLPQPPARVQGPLPQSQVCVQGSLPQSQVCVQGPLPQSQVCVQGPLPQPPAYVQGPPTQPQAQQGKRRASLDAQHVLISGLVSGNGELATTAEDHPNVDFNLPETRWNVPNLYGGDMNAGVMNVLPGQTVGAQDPQELFEFCVFE